MGGEKGRKLNWRQACAKLGCKKSHFYNLVNSGRLPAQRHGELRGIWVYEEDCADYLVRQKLGGDKLCN